MEETSDTLFGSYDTPISDATEGGVVPPFPPLSVRTMVFQTPTTSGRGTIHLMTLTIVPSIHNAYDTPFSYGI
jgi:hypothetical protein